MSWYQDWKEGKPLTHSSTTQSTTTQTTSTQRRLRCEICHSDDLSVVTEYHIELRLRFWRDLLKKCKTFLIVLATIFFIHEYTLEYALENFIDFFVTAPFLVWVALSLTVYVLTVIINTRESHTHLRFVCHCCTYSWVRD